MKFSTYVNPIVSVITCREGLERLRRFLKSLGRYSACSAFLVPQYGAGELSQAFSRMSAVFGGITILDNAPSSIGCNSDKIDHVMFGEVKITGGHVIAEPVYLSQYFPFDQSEIVSQKLVIMAEDDWRERATDSEPEFENKSMPDIRAY